MRARLGWAPLLLGAVYAVPVSPELVSRPIGEVALDPGAISRPIGDVALPPLQQRPAPSRLARPAAATPRSGEGARFLRDDLPVERWPMDYILEWDDLPEPAPRRSALRDVARGALAGLAGTAVIDAAMKLGQRVAPQASPPMRRDPGEFVVAQAEEAAGASLPAPLERGAVPAAHLAYGMGMGALYGVARLASRAGEGRPSPPLGEVALEGAGLGLAVWAIGYLGWLPATGLMPPITEQRPAQVVAPILNHVLYGVVTAAAYHGMRRALGRV